MSIKNPEHSGTIKKRYADFKTLHPVESLSASRPGAESETGTLSEEELHDLATPVGNLRMNSIRVNKPEKTITIRCRLENNPSLYRLPVSELRVKGIPADTRYVYTDFSGEDATSEFPVLATFSPKCAPKSWSKLQLHLLKAYFQGMPDMLFGYNFVNRLDVWFPASMFPFTDIEKNVPGFGTWCGFTFWCTIEPVTEKISLHIAWNGIKHLSQAPLYELEGGELADSVSCSGYIIRRKSLEYLQRPDPERMNAVLNTRLRKQLGIPFSPSRVTNAPKSMKAKLDWFVANIMKSKSFRDAMPYLYRPRNGYAWERVIKFNTLQLDQRWLSAEFGDGHTSLGLKTYANDFKNYGPWKPIDATNVQVLLVMPDDQMQLLPKITIFLNELSRIQRVRFSQLGKPVTYSNFKTAKNQVYAELKRNKPEHKDGKKVMVLFLNPYSKHETDPEKLHFYHEMKGVFRFLQLPSQCITVTRLLDRSFNFFIPNLAAKICAKIGGVPWRAVQPNVRKPSLIVGINASYDRELEQKYVASVSMFTEADPLITQQSLSKENPALLGSAISDALHTARQADEFRDSGRIILHVHKQMGRKDMNELYRAMGCTKIGLPVYVIQTNAGGRQNAVVWDCSNEEVLPPAGLAVRLGDESWLLHINREMKDDTMAEKSGVMKRYYPFANRMRIWKFEPGKEHSVELKSDELRAIMAHVMRMSTLGWRSVVPAALP
ncbi:MAG: hypothetical protein LAT84_14440, partial [Balneolia bacterium]|nr:hypothetical protein [Balneolia bacterium]